MSSTTSGAFKRKRKRAEEKELQKITKLSTFFKESFQKSTAIWSQSQDDETNTTQLTNTKGQDQETSESGIETSRLNSQSELDGGPEISEFIPEQNESFQDIEVPVLFDNTSTVLKGLLQEKYPTDKGNFS